VFTLHTLHLGPIDASLSSFSDTSLIESEVEHSQVEYALDKVHTTHTHTRTL